MERVKAQGTRSGSSEPGGEEGFMLLGLIVIMAIMLMVLGVAASKVAFSLRREREVESARRADQYVRAIRKFYLKNQHYPGSIEQLENTNNIRYLRKRYVDPLTGKDDYRLIAVGQNKTTVKGFFGEPLAGIASTGLGALAGSQSTGMGQTAAGGGGFGATPGAGPGTGGVGAGGAAAGPGAGTPGSTGAGGTAGAYGSSGAAGASNGPLGPLGLPGSGSTGPFMGVGSSATGTSILTVNEQTSYESWEFLYDPRLEKLRTAGALNAGAGSVGANSLGSTPLGSPSNTNGSPTGAGAGGTPPTAPPSTPAPPQQ
jgi:type II secretory pathway pseudopilin PulG